MNHRNLGTSGLRVSLVGLGCNNFGARLDLAGTRKVVDAAIAAGITLFDTADIYGGQGGSETCLGEVLGARRKDIVLATKFGMPMDAERGLTGASRRYIVSAAEASLKRLKTDWIDLYQLHQPDPATPIEETLRALDDLVRQGKVRYIGCSNLPSWQVVAAQWTAKAAGLNAFVSAQDEYSLLARDADRELIPALKANGLGLLPYFPLACGLLTGKYKKGAALPADSRLARKDMQRRADQYFTDANWRRVGGLAAFAEKRGKSLVELAFSWLAARAPVASVIAGAMSPEQVSANVKAASWVLSAEELAEIDTITLG